MNLIAECPECGCSRYYLEVVLHVEVICNASMEVTDYQGDDYLEAALDVGQVLSPKRCVRCNCEFDANQVQSGLLVDGASESVECCNGEDGYLAEQSIVARFPIDGETGRLVRPKYLPKILKEHPPIQTHCCTCGEEV